MSLSECELAVPQLAQNQEPPLQLKPAAQSHDAERQFLSQRWSVEACLPMSAIGQPL